MADAISVSGAISGTDRTMSFETGRMAKLAGGSVLATLGETTVLVTATGAKSVRPGTNFFPLTVDIEERMYAAGKIPGSFFRREARAGEEAILTCRLIDRPLRPSFPDGFRNDVHIVGTVMGADMENPYDVLALNAASAALCLSPIPFDGPVGAVRIAYTAEGEWIPHPTYEQGDAASFEMTVAGRMLDNGDVAVMMVEAGGTGSSWINYEEGAPKADEEVLAAGLEASKQWIAEAIKLQQELVEAAGGKPELMAYELAADYDDDMLAAVVEVGEAKIAETQKIADKMERQAAESAVKAEIIEALGDRFPDSSGPIGEAIRSVTKRVVRERIVNEGIRIDGRKTDEVRPLSSDVQVLPTAHGSGLFQRGDTQVLNVTTLGMGRMDQMIDGISPTERKRYMHHYNFAPFCTGETGFMRGPKRREIGHGALAERALFPVVPTIEEFPYTLRLVSEVLASNGSSSMASVCGSTLSMMDAGVPLKAPVAGIAMGLVHSDDKYIALTDILGAEDAMGDMDFKVAGSADFITALQLDTKIDGIPADVLISALGQAKEARLKILGVMAEAIAEPRPEVGRTAPKIVSFEIPIDKIGEVIGPKGKVINTIQAETGANVTVDDDGTVGTVAIASSDMEAVNEAERQIKLILDPPTAEVGATYTGRVVNITSFGCFVNILPGRDGLVHISKLGGSKRIDKVEDVVSLGDEIEVRVEDVDPKGKISLVPVGAEGGDGGSTEGGDDDTGGGSSASGDGGGRSRGGRGGRDRGDRGGRGGDRDSTPAPVADADEVSFEDAFASELSNEYGDLGPDTTATRRRRGRGRRH